MEGQLTTSGGQLYPLLLPIPAAPREPQVPQVSSQGQDPETSHFYTHTYTHKHTTLWECLGNGYILLLGKEGGSYFLCSSSISPGVSETVSEGKFLSEDWIKWVKVKGDRREKGQRTGCQNFQGH